MPKSNEKTASSNLKIDANLALKLLKIIPDWITPNSLSVLRLLMIPLIVYSFIANNFVAALLLFIAAALLDVLDGTLARSRQQFSRWGLVLDPLADKLLIISVILMLVFTYPFPLLIILALVLDLLMLIFGAWFASRRLSSDASLAIKSNFWGKGKMLTQVLGLVLAIIWLAWPAAWILFISAFVLSLSIFLQIGSGISYLKLARQK